MKNNFLAVALLTAVTLHSCGDPTKKGVVAIPVEITSLSTEEILDVDKIAVFLQSNTSPSKESNELFLKGMDALVNKKMIDSAKIYLESSIKSYPTANAYFELGNVYKTKKKYDEAIKALELAERLDYAPYSNVLYQNATIHSLQRNESQAKKYLELALQAGFSDLKKANEDKDLAYLRDSVNYLFLDAIKAGTKGMSDPELQMWIQFKRKFKTPRYPEILESFLDYSALEKLGYISFDFDDFIPEMRKSRFARDVAQTYHYARLIGENEHHTAIAYIEYSQYVGDFEPKTFIISTYNNKGKRIDNVRLERLELKDGEMIQLQLKSPMNFQADVYELSYKEPREKVGFWDNEVTGKKLIAQYYYTINESGKIVKSKVESKGKDIAQN